MTNSTDRRSGKDRRKRGFSFHNPERRSGFDRRLPQNPILSAIEKGLRALHSDSRIFLLIVSMNFFNLMDYLISVKIFSLGGTEANPILSPMFAYSNYLAGGFKLVIGLVLGILFWKMRRYKAILIALLAWVAVLGLTVLYNCYVLQVAIASTR